MKKPSILANKIVAEHNRIRKFYCKDCVDFFDCKLNRCDCLKGNLKNKQ